MDGHFSKKESLVKTSYFVSPEYKLNKYRKARETFVLGETGLAGEPDKDDKFIHWLRENSFLFKFKPNNPGSEIYGKKNIYCRITNLKIPGQIIKSETNSELQIIPYHRVVRVRSMPNDRALPDELSNALRDNKYEFRSEESELVRRFITGLTEDEKRMF